MNLEDVKNGIRLGKRRKRVGRGHASGSGKTSGRGSKGLKARAGSSVGLTYEGGQMPLFMRIPKRGFNNARNQTEYAVVNLADLEQFESGMTIGLTEIQSKGLVDNAMDGLKILGNGSVSKALKVRAQSFSKNAREAIEKAGGSCEIVAFNKGKKTKDSD